MAGSSIPFGIGTYKLRQFFFIFSSSAPNTRGRFFCVFSLVY
nr:MAG TPA: hypothetical protein [Bacteriophage sp.]